MPISLKSWRVAVVATVALLGAGSTYVITESSNPPPQAPVYADILSDDTPDDSRSPGDPRDGDAPSRSTATQAPASSGPQRPPRTRPATLPAKSKTRAQTRPTRVDFPSLDVSMPIKPVGVDRRGLTVIPKNPSVAGWYRFGAAPGARRGSAVLMAHVDNDDRLGPLAALASLQPGSRVTVTTDDGRVRYRVVRVGRVPKQKLDTDELFSRDSRPRLHIVTCGGPYDEKDGSYRDNVVAVAVPVDRPLG